jgi:hypothetical protein
VRRYCPLAAGAIHPFEGAKTVHFAIRSDANASSSSSITPPGALPPINVFIRAETDAIGPYCNVQISLANSTQYLTSQQGDYYVFDVPFVAFECSSPSTAARIEFQNPSGELDAQFCLDDLRVEL